MVVWVLFKTLACLPFLVLIQFLVLVLIPVPVSVPVLSLVYNRMYLDPDPVPALALV